MEDYEIRKNFANNISRLRKNAKMNQSDLAEKLSYSDKAISKWENGDTIPDIVTIYKIASFFNVSVDDLISDKNIIKQSYKTKNQILVTLIALGLGVLVGAIVFFFLELFNVSKSYISLVATISVDSIILIVFSALWFKKRHLIFSISLLIWSLALLLMVIFNFVNALLIVSIAIIVNVLFDLFFAISK